MSRGIIGDEFGSLRCGLPSPERFFGTPVAPTTFLPMSREQDFEPFFDPDALAALSSQVTPIPAAYDRSFLVRISCSLRHRYGMLDP